MKKIAIFGSTGMTGLCTVEAALKQGKVTGPRNYDLRLSPYTVANTIYLFFYLFTKLLYLK